LSLLLEKPQNDTDQFLIAGFAVVGEYQDPKIREAQTAAFEQMLSWLKNH
jgi:hypothetical protein